MTAVPYNTYARILQTNKILYMPSCLIVEMLTKLYSQVAVINLSEHAHHVVPDLMVLLGRMTDNITATSDAYSQGRIQYFIGDWKDDKVRARKLFFNIMSRLGYISELLGDRERKLLYSCIEDMTEVWAELDQIVSEKRGHGDSPDNCTTCQYFRSDHPTQWQKVMANIVLNLADEADSLKNPDTYLLIVCYKRIKTVLTRTIKEVERKSNTKGRFSPEKILFVSNEEIPISCPKCTIMTDALRNGTSDVIHQEYAQKSAARRPGARKLEAPVLTGRYPMPPTLAGMVRF